MKKILFRLLLVAFTLSSLLSFAPDPNTNRRVVLSQNALLTETKAWLNVLPSKPSPAVIFAVNEFIKTAKSNGDWQKLDRFWLFAQDKQGNVIYSIVNPTSTAIIEVNSPTWASMGGYTFNGTTMYLRTGFVPSAGVNYVLNSASQGIYCTVNTAGTFGWDMGATDATNSSNISLRDATDNAYGKVNNATAAFVTIGSRTDSRGFWYYERTTSTALTMYRNGASIGTDTDVSTARPTVEMYIGALNLNGVAASFSNKKIAIAFAGGSGFSANWYNTVQRLATRLGFNV